jgi:AraC-like DNA-binding protein
LAATLEIAGDITRELLRDHNLFRTQDLAEARAEVARVFCAHRLVTTSKDGRVNAVHNRAVFDSIALNYLDYGTDVLITPGELTSFYLMQIPLNGSAEIKYGSQMIHSTPGNASLASPTEFLDMHWHVNNPQFLVYFSRTELERTLCELLGAPMSVPLRFDLSVDTATPTYLRWHSLVDILLRDAESKDLSLHPSVRRQLEDLIKSALITGFHNNYSDCLERFARPAVPRAIRRAMQLCEESPEQPLTVTELAAGAGVGIRSLQAGFKEHVGLTPMDYLRDIRLQRVHAELTNRDIVMSSIAQVAFAWGFTHLGRFAQLYRARFGELPSHTLRS